MMLANPGGHVMSPKSFYKNRVTETHVLAVRTRRTDGTNFESLQGRVFSRSADIGVESIRLPNGVDTLIGDTVMESTSDAAGKGAPCRLAGTYYHPSVDFLHDTSQVTAPLDDPGRRI